MTTYSEKLKDPRWQKLRLEIMSRDKFTCQWCSETTKTLNVHHFVYSKSRNPWDISDESDLITICEDCHKIDHSKKLSKDSQEIISYIRLIDYKYPGISKDINALLLNDLKKYVS